MTPKENALKLTRKYTDTLWNLGIRINKQSVIQCALIAVDEIDKAIDFDWMEVQNLDRQHTYWQQVRLEIENL
jgi:hypothetical protein